VRLRLLTQLGIVTLGILVLAAACGGGEETGDCLAPKDGHMVSVACDAAGTPFPTPTPTSLPQNGGPISGDGGAADGQTVFLTNGTCAICHTIDDIPQARGQTGPNLSQVSAKGEAYIRQSLMDPNAVMAEDCPNGPCTPDVMPQNFGTALSEAEMDALVNFLLQQR
jgi:mono/diheme cytochrome c family protein